MSNPERSAAQEEAWTIANRARHRSGVAYKTLSDACCVNVTNTKKRFADPEEYGHIGLTDIVLWARNDETARFARCLLAEINAIVDFHGLTIGAVAAMSERDETSALIRMLLRPVAERLWPERMLPTAAPENVQTVAVAATGEIGKRKARR